MFKQNYGTVKWEVIHNYLYVILIGELNGESFNELQADIEKIRFRVSKVLINMEKLSYIDSAAIGVATASTGKTWHY